MKPLKLKVKIMSGSKEEVEKEFNEFKDSNSVYFSQTQVTQLVYGSSATFSYHIFVYYE